MSCGSVLRPMEERHVAYQIDLMVWSNRLDLLALSNFKGEIQIHRLSWQKVWNFGPPKENLKVQAISWRPDGKALAIGYDSGCVCIISVEDKELLDRFYLHEEVTKELENPEKSGVTFLTWLIRSGTLPNVADYNIYEDSSIFLSKPVLSNVSYKNRNIDIREFMDIQEQSQLNMLFTAFGNGSIHLNVFGRFPFCTIHLRDLLNDEYGEYKIIDINLSDKFSIMQVFYLDKATKNIFVAIINVNVLSAFSEEIFTVANRHVQIGQLLASVQYTMISITEAWENIILEMDAKMANYAASVPEGAVSADFLELLMMGVPSDELELFLIQDLTTKGLKKFGSSVELSYSTIQKLVLKQLNIIGQSMTYHLAELRGLARIPDRYKILGLSEEVITEAIKSSCAFLNKCLELQQVIDISMRNYKAFFRWLYGVIVRLLDEQAPTEICKVTQQDLTHIADFLFNFDSVKVNESDKTVRFNLEKLSQYLQDKNLSILPDECENPWQKFLKENPCLLKDNDTFFSMTEFRKFSLVQQQNHLKAAISEVFDVSGKDFGTQFTLLYNLKCYEDISLTKSPSSDIRLSQIHDPGSARFMTVFYHHSCDGFCFKSINIHSKDNTYKSLKGYFTNLSDENDDILEILDVMFYSTEYISVLLKHGKKQDGNIFVQIPVKFALEHSVECSTKDKMCVFNETTAKVNFTPLLEQGAYITLDKMDGFRIAVSGGRKVAVVLSRSKRKVRICEMVDAEDEDDETKSHVTNQHSDSQDVSEDTFAALDDKSINQSGCSNKS